jgi:hypothetical protein
MVGEISNKRKKVIEYCDNHKVCTIEEIDINNDIKYCMKHEKIPKIGCPLDYGLDNFSIDLCVSDDENISINLSEKHCETCWRIALGEATKPDIDIINNKTFLTKYFKSIRLANNIKYIKTTLKKENCIISKFTIEILTKDSIKEKSFRTIYCEDNIDSIIKKINNLPFDTKKLFNILCILCSHIDHDSLVCTYNSSKNELGNSVSIKYIDRF